MKKQPYPDLDADDPIITEIENGKIETIKDRKKEWLKESIKQFKKLGWKKEKIDFFKKMINKMSIEEIKKFGNEMDFFIENRHFHKGFIGYYERYQHLLTSAPTQFATHLIIQIIGHAINNSSYHSITPEKVPHNTYLALIGESGTTKKTTAQDKAKQIIPENKLLPENFSPEALLEVMSEMPQGILYHGEFSALLRNIKGRGYLAWFKEISNDLFRREGNYRRKLKSKDVTIEKPYFSQCTTGTPIQVMNNVDEELLLGGFMPRFILVHGDGEYRPRTMIPSKAWDMNANVEKVINKLYNVCEYGGFEFTFSKSATARFQEIDEKLSKDKRYKEVQAFVSRYSEYIIVYADIHMLSKMIQNTGFDAFTGDNIVSVQQYNSQINKINTLTRGNIKSVNDVNDVNHVNRVNDVNDRESFFIIDPEKHGFVPQDNICKIEVDVESVNTAWDVIKPCLEYAKQLCQYVLEEKPVAQVIRVLRRYGTPDIKHSKCLTYSRLSAKKFKEAIETLEERKEVKVKYADEEKIKPFSYEYVGDK